MSSLRAGTQTVWGIVGVVAMVLAVVAAVVIYVLPLGHRTYTAAFENTGGAHAGDDVRIAGISVGTVTGMQLRDDHVEVAFEVREDIELGDATSMGVRLLTPVGGHYFTLRPGGSGELPDGRIPIEHTTVPFTLSDTVEAATPILRDLNGKTLRENVVELDKAVQSQPESIRRITDNLTSLTAAVADRQDDLDRSLNVADEYLGALATDREILLGLLQQIGIITSKLGAKRADVAAAADKLYRLFNLLHRPIVALDQGLGPTIEELESIAATLREQTVTLDDAIVAGREFSDSMAEIFATGTGAVVDRGDDVITGTALCLPVPGRSC
ncbi:MCE family protein [Rhodococcoides corynebacterioides]|uniref:MCE family protein n=1 Tax=Rhodococcoides corynebacterioides TaxID=53972 RepID=UPI001C9AB827|nr:MCE family protein [Rhodococcus corynebacterioides]MBY6363894.1 MCE family protein [Rhodococcus corynebacterioides]